MVDTNTTSALHREARLRVISYALRRAETVFTVAFTAGLTAAAAADVVLPRDTMAIWPILGAAGVSAIMITALKANRYLRRFVTHLFYERFDADKLQLNELRRGMASVLEQHRLIFGAIAARPESPLGGVATEMDEWVTQIYAVAQRIDELMNDERVLLRVQQLTQPETAGSPAQALIKHVNALAEINPDAIPLTDIERAELWRIKHTVTGATAQLDDALFTMAHILHSLRTARITELGRPFAQRTQEIINEQRGKLSESETLIQALFQRYTGVVVIDQTETIDAVQA